jgi:hypothetical protein
MLLYTDVKKIHHVCKTQFKKRTETATGYHATCWRITSLVSLLCPVRLPQNRVIVYHFSEVPLSCFFKKQILPMSSTRGSTIPCTERGNDPVLEGWRANLIPGLGPTSLSPPSSIYTRADPLRASVYHSFEITSNSNNSETMPTGSPSVSEADLSRLNVNSDSESPPVLVPGICQVMNEVYGHNGIRHRAQRYLSVFFDRLNQGVQIDTRTWSVSSAKARGINTRLQYGILRFSAGSVISIMLEEASDLLEMYKEILLQLQQQGFARTISANAAFGQLQKVATCTSGLILALIARRRGVAANFACSCTLEHHIDHTLDNIGYAEQTGDTVSRFLYSFQEVTSQILRDGRRAHAPTLPSSSLFGSMLSSLAIHPTDMSIQSIPE